MNDQKCSPTMADWRNERQTTFKLITLPGHKRYTGIYREAHMVF